MTKFDCITFGVRPSFSANWQISLSSSDHGKSFVLTFSKCKLRKPIEDLSDELREQFVEKWQLEIEKEEVEDFTRICQNVSILAVPQSIMGGDGTNFFVSIACGFNEVRYEWWEDLPPEWADFGAIEKVMRKWSNRFDAINNVEQY